ncbi:MAG: glycoside hydrolase family 1 protein [Patescibacteria group bacterium]
MKKYEFPKNFLWGSATSAHQIEGNNINDWSEWERKNAKKLAQNAVIYWKNWQKEKFPEISRKENYISGKATNHYNLYKKDFDIAKSLGHNVHRFSIEWSRIEPEEGKFNEKEIEHYRDVLIALKERGIEPFVTLWHWPLPLWLSDKGGWEAENSEKYFENYAKKVASSLNGYVKFWITINEPEIYAGHSYLKGAWPPQKKNIFIYIKIINRLTVAHNLAYKAIKEINKDFQIGIAKHNIYFEAYKNRFINRIIKSFIDWWWNYYFLNKISKFQDFIGLNHYLHNRIDYGFNKNENKKVSDMGWELYPESIYHAIIGLKKYNLPIYITENGIADAHDDNREWFISESLRWVHKAIEDGSDVRGYMYWSLLDNFEWDKGFWPRFGLIEVNYETLERKIRSSALKYAKICKSNELII